ncbi:MAG: family 16 glycoside hydrolase [Verrucomicrobiota bacterium]
MNANDFSSEVRTPRPPRSGRSICPRWLSALLLGLISGSCLWAEAAAEEDFESLFDGASLHGWLGQDMSFWTVEDGAITGTISQEHAPRMNQYLVWQREMVQDFELKLQFRFTACSAKTENGGFQFRSRRLPNGDVAGYQVDNNFGQPWKVRLYDEHGRHDLALEGEESTFDAAGRKHTDKLVLEPGASDFRLDEWHEYHLIATGPKLELRINGKTVARATDNDPDSFEPAGILALQLHTGPPMKVQFRGIRFKRLPATRALSDRERLLLGAALHWNLGERLNSQQPPLKAVGQISPGQRDANDPVVSYASLAAACFDTNMALNDSPTWNIPGHGLTVYFRARMTNGVWSGPLFGKGGRSERQHYALLAGDGPDGGQAVLQFQVQTDRGVATTSFPIDRISPTAWLNLVGWYDGRHLRLFCNGQQMAEQPASGDLVPNADPVLLGGELDQGRAQGKCNGQVAEAALWTRALDERELSQLFQSANRPSKAAANQGSAQPSFVGVVIDHSPAASGIYIGSPSLAVLPDGSYVAAHDEFGPKSTEHSRAVTRLFGSADRGASWQPRAVVAGAFWSSLFVHKGNLYLLGTDKHHGNAVIRRSTDAGRHWTSPETSTSGLLRDEGQFHCAPVPVLEHGGRVWRAMEWRQPPEAWGINYRASMMSVPIDADLLDASQWTFSEFLPSDRRWNGGDMGAWLEGNAVLGPDGQLYDLLRVQTKSPREKAALVRISADGKSASFDPAAGFVDFPGGAKKFTVRFDPRTEQYWSLASIVAARHRADDPGRIRNTLALTRSADLTHWEVRCVLLYHPDVGRHGFQYVDWLFDGDDLIAACRTATDDDDGGAHNNHDANFLMFHRFAGFRDLRDRDSVPMDTPATQAKE